MQKVAICRVKPYELVPREESKSTDDIKNTEDPKNRI